MSKNDAILDPTLEDILPMLKSDVFKSMRCVGIGKIQKVDGTRKTLEIQIVFKRVTANDEVRSFPLLIDVPFVTVQGGGVAVQMPVAAGDDCLVFFADRNIDAWFRSGQESVPFDGRAHDASDGIALVGLNSLQSNLVANPTDEGRIISGQAKVGVTQSGDEAFVVQGDARLSAKSGKIEIKNTATDLLTAIQGLITAIEGVTVQGPGTYPLTTAAIAALDAQKTIFQGLLST